MPDRGDLKKEKIDCDFRQPRWLSVQAPRYDSKMIDAKLEPSARSARRVLRLVGVGRTEGLRDLATPCAIASGDVPPLKYLRAGERIIDPRRRVRRRSAVDGHQGERRHRLRYDIGGNLTAKKRGRGHQLADFRSFALRPEWRPYRRCAMAFEKVRRLARRPSIGTRSIRITTSACSGDGQVDQVIRRRRRPQERRGRRRGGEKKKKKKTKKKFFFFSGWRPLEAWAAQS